MLMLRKNIANKHAIVMACLLTGISPLGISAPQETVGETEIIAPPVESSSLESIQDLDEGISMEERIQLRRALVEYARAVDPGHIQIEERRRIMRKRIQERFLGSDKDNDGGISREEAAETLPQIFRHFIQVDLNADGLVSMSELEAAQAKAIERRQAATVKEENAAQADGDKPKSKQAAANGKDDL